MPAINKPPTALHPWVPTPPTPPKSSRLHCTVLRHVDQPSLSLSDFFAHPGDILSWPAVNRPPPARHEPNKAPPCLQLRFCLLLSSLLCFLVKYLHDIACYKQLYTFKMWVSPWFAHHCAVFTYLASHVQDPRLWTAWRGRGCSTGAVSL